MSQAVNLPERKNSILMSLNSADAHNELVSDRKQLTFLQNRRDESRHLAQSGTFDQISDGAVGGKQSFAASAYGLCRNEKTDIDFIAQNWIQAELN